MNAMRSALTSPGLGMSLRIARPRVDLPEPELADDAELFAAQLETDLLQRIDRSGRRDVPHREVLDLQQRLIGQFRHDRP